MPAGRTTPPMTTSLAAMMFAVSRQVMNSAAQVTKRHDMPPPLSDIRHDRRRLLAERPLQRRRELRVVLVATREDAALGDLPRKVLEQLGERLGRHLVAARVVDVGLTVAHLQRVGWPRSWPRAADLAWHC